MAGIRWSWQEAQAETSDFIKNTVTEDKKRIDEAFSPKVGLVFQPTKNSLCLQVMPTHLHQIQDLQ